MRTIPVLAMAAALSIPGAAQEMMHGDEPGAPPILINGDMAALESGEPRKDLNCSVTSNKPSLGFDLKFHSEYLVSLPIRELDGPGNFLSIVFRVQPKSVPAASPVYFKQQFRVPKIDDTSGAIALQGKFDLGEGSYRVDWLMRDFAGRLCTSSWDVDAALAPKDKPVVLALAANSIRPSQEEKFQAEPPVARAEGRAPLSVKVLMNFAPERPDSAALNPQDRAALVSILRDISRNPQIGTFSLVAFNIQAQKVLYRQNAADQIDFPDLGEALKSKLRLGTVDLSQLSQKHGDTEFLSTLIHDETADGSKLDGLIFVGPKAMLDENVPEDDLKEIGGLDYPVFYLNYNPDPMATPWKDAIGRMVKFFKGREFTISGPRDLWTAVSDTVSRMTKLKQERLAGTPTGQ